MRGSALLSPSKDDYTAAIHTVKAYKDQPITLFDAVTAKLSSELGWPVWTYDYHFDLMQISVWR
ncbi:hypothetical protein MYX75_03135 [Acidobacteria bacterium AH-259-A15]|nr:hypothetical protein [Acidobacteria bacterium AH-259-A15]